MKTSLRYTTDRDEEYNDNTRKYESHIRGRYYEFCVTGAKSKEEHDETIENFRVYLKSNNIDSDGFSNGTWEEAVRSGSAGQKDYAWLNIYVEDVDQKEEIKELYDEWKKGRKGGV